MRIEMESNQETKINLVTERDKHVQNADNAYSSKRHDKEISKLDSTSVCNAFDLQQCLPTPFLETSVAFYKRLYWTYNLSTHNLTSGSRKLLVIYGMRQLHIEEEVKLHHVYTRILCSCLIL